MKRAVLFLYILYIFSGGIAIAGEMIVGGGLVGGLVSVPPTESIFSSLAHEISIIETTIKPEPISAFINSSQFIVSQFCAAINSGIEFFVRPDYSGVTKSERFEVLWLGRQCIGNHPPHRDSFRKGGASPGIFKRSHKKKQRI